MNAHIYRGTDMNGLSRDCATPELAEKIFAQVSGLGQSAEAIAANLRLEGVQGHPGRTTQCAISRFITKHYPSLTVQTAPKELIINAFGDTEHTFSLPEPLRQFVWEFDAGDYPELCSDESLGYAD